MKTNFRTLFTNSENNGVDVGSCTLKHTEVGLSVPGIIVYVYRFIWNQLTYVSYCGENTLSAQVFEALKPGATFTNMVKFNPNMDK